MSQPKKMAAELLNATPAQILLALLGAGVTCYVLFGKSKAKGKSPFLEDTRKKKEPMETDKSVRDAILKNGYSAKKVEGIEFDAIIVGSGIGGLMTGALMARAGKKVLILEQHDQAGGCCHSFHEKGFEFDTGIHYIGEMRNNTTVRFLFDQVSNGQLKWTNVRDDFDTVVLVDHDGDAKKAIDKLDKAIDHNEPLESTHISFMSSREETIKSLEKAFPGEEKAIKKYFQMMTSFRQSMLGYVGLKLMPLWLGRLLVKTGLIHWTTDFFKHSKQSVSQVLEKLTDNAKLRTVLAYNFGDYGTAPGDAPWSMHAALQNHFLKGVSFPVGGSSEIGFHIIPTILKAGGKVLVRGEVEAIVTNENGDAAVGVKMKRGGDIIRAPIIISDAGLYNTVQDLLPKQSYPMFKHLFNGTRSGMGGMSVYIGLNGTAEELGLNGKHYWAFWVPDGKENLDKATNDYMSKPSATEAAKEPVPLLFISFPSAKDPTWASRHPGKSTATVVTVASYSWFEKWENERIMHRGKEYVNAKQALGEMIWKQTMALFPQLKGKVQYFDVGTPVTNKYYLAANKGEMYGMDHNIERFSPSSSVELRPETPMKNLYLTGQDIFNCGFVGAAFGGLLCASSVLGRNVYEDLNNLKKKSPPCDLTSYP